MSFIKKLQTKYRYSLILLRELVITDLKLRYQNSVLGYLWSLLRPLAVFLILYIVFVKAIKVGADTPHFAIYMLVGIVIWNYFVEVTTGSVGAIVQNGDIIRKINFPKYIIVLARSFSALINLALNMIVVFIFMLVAGTDVSKYALLAPLLLVELFILSLGVGFFLSALFVRFRDINYIWEVVIQGAFYATPILYPLSKLPQQAQEILILNPMAQIIQDARYMFVTPTDTIATIYGSGWARLITVGASIVIAVLSALFFRKRSRYFAEEV